MASSGDTVHVRRGVLGAKIVAALSRPPSMVGRRLRTEQNLASLLGVSRWQLRDVLQELERKGLLTRQRGSGTYVRRIPLPEEVAAALRGCGAESVVESGEVAEGDGGATLAESLFADEAGARERAPVRALRQGKPLRIAVWGNLQTTSSTTRAVQAGIIRRLNQEDHRLDIQSFHYEDAATIDLSREEIASQLKLQACDAYVMHEELMPIQHEVAPTLPQRVPVIYYGTPGHSIEPEPAVHFDGNDAARRAVHHLADEGYKRIGLIRRWFTGALYDKDPHDRIVAAYREAMAQRGLDYDAVARVDSPISESVIAAMTATRELLEGASPPDALYVSDDHLLAGVQAGIDQAGCRPGHDFGVISISVRGGSLPVAEDLSHMQFDADYLASLLVYALLRRLSAADAQFSGVKVDARWCPSRTHRRAAGHADG